MQLCVRGGGAATHGHAWSARSPPWLLDFSISHIDHALCMPVPTQPMWVSSLSGLHGSRHERSCSHWSPRCRLSHCLSAT